MSFYLISMRPSRDRPYYVIGYGGRPHRFPHNNFSSVYRIFTKLGYMIPLWKGKNPIYFGVITIIPFDNLYRRAYFVMHTFLVWNCDYPLGIFKLSCDTLRKFTFHQSKLNKFSECYHSILIREHRKFTHVPDRRFPPCYLIGVVILKGNETWCLALYNYCLHLSSFMKPEERPYLFHE